MCIDVADRGARDASVGERIDDRAFQLHAAGFRRGQVVRIRMFTPTEQARQRPRSATTGKVGMFDQQCRSTFAQAHTTAFCGQRSAAL